MSQIHILRILLLKHTQGPGCLQWAKHSFNLKSRNICSLTLHIHKCHFFALKAVRNEYKFILVVGDDERTISRSCGVH